MAIATTAITAMAMPAILPLPMPSRLFSYVLASICPAAVRAALLTAAAPPTGRAMAWVWSDITRVVVAPAPAAAPMTRVGSGTSTVRPAR